jgi:hypothetical protein
MVEDEDKDVNADSDTFAVLTRRRLDFYFLMGFLAGSILGIVSICISGQLKFIIIPFSVLPLWFIVHFFLCPKKGIRTTTIRGDVRNLRNTPGGTQSVSYFLVVLLLFMGLSAYELFVRGVPSNAPPQWYHWVAAVVFAFLLVAGGWFIDRRYGPRPHREVDSHAGPDFENRSDLRGHSKQSTKNDA